MQPINKFFSILVFAAALAGCAASQEATDKFKALSTAVPPEVKILFESDATTFPAYWAGMKGEALPQNLRSQVKVVLERALSKYSPEVLKYNLKRIYIFNKIDYQGLAYGGTYDPKSCSIYLLNVDWAPGFIEESFHHEFSSLLLCRYPPKYFTGKWEILSDYNRFAYTNEGMNALRNGKTGTRYDKKSLEQGFLNEYSMSGPEEDFNCISEGLFCGGKQFWANVDAYPAIKAKAEAAMEFYASIDKRFTESYLRQLPPPTSGSTRWPL